MTQDIIVTSYANIDSYKQRAIDNFKYLWSMKDSCTQQEQIRLKALNDPSNDWKYSAFNWLDSKRCFYDAQYDRIRTLQTQKAQVLSRIKQLEQDQAIAKLKRVADTGLTEPTDIQAANARKYLAKKGIL